MRKLLLLVSAAVLIFYIYSSCKKNDTSSSSEVNSLKALTKNWISAQKNLISNNSGFIDTLIQSADWENLSASFINNREQVITIPVHYNNNQTGLVFIIDKPTNTIEESYLGEVNSNISNQSFPAVVENFY
jgi:hypothetical protein